jgi:META domain
MKRHATVLTLIALIAPSITGCDGDDQESLADNPPIGTFVSRKNWTGKGLAFAKPVPVTIGKSYVGWESACNGFGAKRVRITADLLDFTEASLSNTLALCMGKGEQKQEKDLETFFRSSPDWSLDGNRLTLSTDSVELVLRRDDTPPDS